MNYRKTSIYKIFECMLLTKTLREFSKQIFKISYAKMHKTHFLSDQFNKKSEILSTSVIVGNSK